MVGGWLTPRPGRFTSGNDLVPLQQEAGYAPGLLWMRAENLAATGIGSADRSACSESLYRLSCLRAGVVNVKNDRSFNCRP
jgi:hypothetical protein